MPKPIPVEIMTGAGLKIGDVVTVKARHDRIAIERSKPKYALHELFAQCDDSVPFLSELEGWV